MAVDLTDNSESIANIDLRIVEKTDNIIACNTDYLVIKVSEKSKQAEKDADYNH